MPNRKKNPKRELENPGDISVSLAPAASKKPKAQARSTTRSAAKQALLGTIDTKEDVPDSPVVPPPPANAGATKKRRAAPKPKVSTTLGPTKEPIDPRESTVPTTEVDTPKVASTTTETGKLVSLTRNI